MAHQRGADPTGILMTAPADKSAGPEQSAPDKELVSTVINKWHLAERSRARYVRIWEFLKTYARGEQNLYQNYAGQLVRVSEKNSKRLDSQHNILKIVNRQLHAKLTKYEPQFSVTAANGDTDQTQAALAATAFWEWLSQAEDFQIKYHLSIHDVVSYGMGLMQVTWDPDAGRRMTVCDRCGYVEEDLEHLDEACPSCVVEAEEAQATYEQSLAVAEQTAAFVGEAVSPGPPPETPIGVLEEWREGSLRVGYVPIRSFVPEPGKTQIKDMRYWFEVYMRPVSELRDKYPHVAHLIEPGHGTLIYNAARNARTGREGLYEFDVHSDSGTEIIYHERPSLLYPKGRRIAVVNNSVLAEHRDPHPMWYLDRPHVFALPWDPENETFFPQPWMESAWHRQKELDENQTQQREASELMSNGKIGIPNNSGVTPDELSAKAGQAFVFNTQAGPPVPIQLGRLDQSLLERGGILISSIYEHAGISAAEQGMLTANSSGRLAALMESIADQQVGPILKRHWNELGELVKCALQIAIRNYSKDFQYRVRGDEGLQIFTLAEMNLKDGFDIRVEAEDGLSTNQSLRLQNAMDLWNMGIFGNPATGMPDIARFVKFAKLRIPGIGGDSTSAQHTHAHWMLRMLEQGNFDVAQPKPWDDPYIHGMVCLNWLETKGYAPNADPMVVQQVQALQQYYTLLAMQGAAAPPGQPPQAASGAAGGGSESRTSAALNNPGAGGQNAAELQQAATAVQGADRAAEGVARSRAGGQES